LRALRVFAKTSHATKPFIGFGDPLLRRSGGENRRKAPSVQPYKSYYNGAVVDIDRLRNGLPALPETGDELRAVARELGASNDDVKLGAAATVTAVKTTALEQYRVIAFATHGLVAGEVGGLSEPALVLSLPDNPTAEDDGLLTASRIARLILDADWAVLSACNTAAGDAGCGGPLRACARGFLCGRALAPGVVLAGGIRRRRQADDGCIRKTKQGSRDRPGRGAASFHSGAYRRPIVGAQCRSLGLGAVRSGRGGRLGSAPWLNNPRPQLSIWILGHVARKRMRTGSLDAGALGVHLLMLLLRFCAAVRRGRCWCDHGNRHQRSRIHRQCQKPDREFSHALLPVSAQAHPLSGLKTTHRPGPNIPG